MFFGLRFYIRWWFYVSTFDSNFVFWPINSIFLYNKISSDSQVLLKITLRKACKIPFWPSFWSITVFSITPSPKLKIVSFFQNHQSPIWNGKVVPVVHLLDLFWRWFQFYCLLIVTREWSFNFCKMKNRRSSIIVLKDSPKNNPIKTGGVKYFDNRLLQLCAWLCTISSSHLSILMCIHSKYYYLQEIKNKICLVIIWITPITFTTCNWR